MSDNLKIINFIGCGHVGKTLGRLWNDAGVFVIGDVLNRTMKSSLSAVDFIQAGRAIDNIDQMSKADIYFIATPDDQIIESCKQLAQSSLLESNNIVFQCSGSIPSTDLNLVKAQGALVASIHPVKSFANSEAAYESFGGTYCGAEGDEKAITVLAKSFEKIGGEIFSIDAKYKTEYHAANVIVCNYLTALLEVGTKVYERAGVPPALAMQIMQPLVQETVTNNLKLGTVEALTGPIARGDHKVVRKQLERLKNWDKEIADLYQKLGVIALDISEKKGVASEEAIKKLRELLDKD